MAGVIATATTQFRTLVGLRGRLALRQFRGKKNEAWIGVLVALSLTPALVMSAVGLYAAFLHAPEPWPLEILGASLTILWGVWLLFPMFAGTFSETLDLTRLIIYPLHRRALVGSMVVGTVFDFTTALTIPIFWAVLAAWSNGPGLLFGLSALLILWVHMVIGYQLIATTLAGVFQSRRFREFLIVLGVMVGITIWSLQFWLDNVSEQFQTAFKTGTLSQIRPLDVLQWAPPGAVARALGAAASDNYASAIRWLGYALVLVPPLLWVWWRVLVRVTMQGGQLFVARSRRQKKERARARPETVPRTGFTILVMKELRIWWRAPRLRMQLFQALVMPVVLTFLIVKDDAGSMIAFAPVMFGVMAVTMAYTNVLAFEGDGIATLLMSPLRRDRIYFAKAAAFAAILAVPYVIGVAAMLVLKPGLFTVAGALAGVCIVLVAMTVNHLTSTMFPWAMPDDTKRGFSRNRGGFQAVLAMLAGVLAMGAITAPIWLLLIPAAIGGKGAAAVIVAFIGVVYGALVFYFGTRRIARTFQDREAQIYQALKPKQDG